LSEIPEATVLVLEAGEAQMSETVDIPYRWTEHFFTDIDWAYMSVPQPALGNRPIYSAADKGVGGSTATRLLFEGKRCVGVEYAQDNERKEVRANHEVILCASGVQSPKLLMLSGIGRPEHLQRFDVPVLVDLPGVGETAWLS
jgi:choline dehydrogenase-like flavoprotein